MAGDLVSMGFLPPGLIERMPLGNPIRADTRAEGLHLRVQDVQFSFEHIRTLVELELGKALGQNGLNLLVRVRFQ